MPEVVMNSMFGYYSVRAFRLNNDRRVKIIFIHTNYVRYRAEHQHVLIVVQNFLCGIWLKIKCIDIFKYI